MRIITMNLNGIRSAHKKGAWPWLLSQGADVICLQEVRAAPSQMASECLNPLGYHAFYVPASKPGYSGVGLLCRRHPDRIRTGIGWTEFDSEGRYVAADFGNLTVVSLYVPSGTSGEARQAWKMEVLSRLGTLLQGMATDGRDYVVCGDVNIAHKEIDLKNWRANQKMSGFLPEERAWMDHVTGMIGFVDAFRAVNREEGQYTWWSQRAASWERNVGWRIDYQLTSPRLPVLAASIYRGEKFSDHAPLTIDYDYEIASG